MHICTYKKLATENGGGSSNHYAHLRSGGTDGLLRSLTRVTLGRAILMKVSMCVCLYIYAPKKHAVSSWLISIK